MGGTLHGSPPLFLSWEKDAYRKGYDVMYSEKEIKTARAIVFGSSAFAFVALLLVAYLVSGGVV